MIPAPGFDLVFDAAHAGWPDYVPLLIGVVVAGIPAYLDFAAGRRWNARVAFFVFWVAIWIGFSFIPYVILREEVAYGHCRKYEGVVKNFHAVAVRGIEREESFDVAGAHFEYSTVDLKPGYRGMVSTNGVPLAGRYARICAVDGHIGRLEVRRR